MSKTYPINLRNRRSGDADESVITSAVGTNAPYTPEGPDRPSPARRVSSRTSDERRGRDEWRKTAVLTQEECMENFWRTVAELTVKYADKLAERERSRRA